jgi:hypothetical protein
MSSCVLMSGTGLLGTPIYWGWPSSNKTCEIVPTAPIDRKPSRLQIWFEYPNLDFRLKFTLSWKLCQPTRKKSCQLSASKKNPTNFRYTTDILKFLQPEKDRNHGISYNLAVNQKRDGERRCIFTTASSEMRTGPSMLLQKVQDDLIEELRILLVRIMPPIGYNYRSWDIRLALP